MMALCSSRIVAAAARHIPRTATKVRMLLNHRSRIQLYSSRDIPLLTFGGNFGAHVLGLALFCLMFYTSKNGLSIHTVS